MVCKDCKYFDTCGDDERTEPCKGYKKLDIPACAENCPYKEECPHAVGIHYDVWGEGIECRNKSEELPW